MKPGHILLLAVMSLTAAAQPELPAKENLHLFLLAGQSNMAGRGKADELSQKADPRILALNRKLEWQVAKDPIHWDKKAAGVGLAKPFAAILTENDPDISVGLIPSACGASPISAWEPGKFWQPSNSHPWDDAITRARLAMESGTLKAILWHQGESDSNPKDAPLYEKRLTDLIGRFRKELSAPELPFIIGQLGEFPKKPWNEHQKAIDAAHRAVAEKVPHVKFVPIKDPVSIGDNIHFDTPTLREFAKGYADAYLNHFSH